MKTGKRKNQKYISAMLIATMSVGNVTGVLAEPVNTVAVSKEQGSEVLETAVPTENQEISIVRGESLQLDKPESFSENVTWSAKFLKKDGTFLRNVGYSKIKRELKEGETDGTRKAGDASAEHLLKVEADENGNAVITGENKGNVVVVAQDDQGKTAQWKVEILYQSPSKLPSATAEDYGKIRQAWKESLIGKDLVSEEGGAEVLEEINQEAEALWNAYVYKGQEECGGIPWAEDEGAKGNKNIPYEDDAVEFRVSFKKVLSMCKAYAAEGGALYQNQDMLKDITNILDFLCGSCYTAKSQTDNWWTWEIGIPKDLIPALILIYDGLTEEQVMAYTETLYFFQPDPFHEGVINTASTHGQGYREAQGANIIDCSTTAVGLGALREDNELVYLGMLASSQTFVIQNVEDSAQIAANGYNSGFYPDGSYLDHI